MTDPRLALFAAIGGDRYVAHSEAGLDTERHGRRVWDVYDRQFGRFTGAGLDPGFHRLRQGQRALSLPRFEACGAVVVVGDLTLDAAAVAALRQRRGQLAVVASAAGARGLLRHDLHADLVLIERGEAVASHGLGAFNPRTEILADRSVPLAGGAPAAVRLAPSLPSWGLWPATAVALALTGGARLVGVAGVHDEDEPGAPALTALLDVIATLVPGQVIALDDASPVGPPWLFGWPALDALRGEHGAPGWLEYGRGSLLLDEARADLGHVGIILPDARQALILALAAREGRGDARLLTRAVEMMLAWGADACLRWSLQRGLGLTFLPRLWRLGISMSPASRLWRPLVLALHELVTQADALAQALDAADREAGRAPTHRVGPRPAAPTGVTVVVAALGADGAHLGAALDSLATQTYKDFEILVVHDGAADLADEARQRAGERLRVLVTRPGATLSEALNDAITVAAGDLIAIHDATGISHPQRLARQVAYLRAHPEIDVVATAAVALDTADTAGVVPLCHRDVQTHDALARRLDVDCPMVHGSVLTRREILRQAGGYRPAAAVTADDRGRSIDHDLWLRLRATSRFAKLPTRLYGRRASLAGAGAAIPAGAGNRHAPAGTEGPLADPQTGRRLPALELG